MVDIINQFTKTGYNCDLITGLLVERDIPLSEHVKVRKIIRYNNSTSFKRIFTWGWGTLQIFFIILFRYRNAHLFIVSNPPMATLLPLVLTNSFSLLIFDVYPDAISELGILSKQSLIIRLWRKANIRIYYRAKSLFTITDGMKELLKSYTSGKKIETIPLWSDNGFLKKVPAHENPFIDKHNPNGRFLVLYSGNIGISNNVEVLTDVSKLVDADNVIFVIIGTGARKRQLEEKVKIDKCGNILILPWQDVKLLRYTLSAADVAVVTLGKGASKLAIPSKIFSLLSAGIPILGIAGEDSDLHNFIEKHEIGQCFLPEKKDDMARYIKKLYLNPEYCEKLSKNARFASQFFTKDNADKFVNECKEE